MESLEQLSDTRTPASRQCERDELNRLTEKYLQAGGSITTIPYGVMQHTEQKRRSYWSRMGSLGKSRSSEPKKAGGATPAGDTDSSIGVLP